MSQVIAMQEILADGKCVCVCMVYVLYRLTDWQQQFGSKVSRWQLYTFVPFSKENPGEPACLPGEVEWSLK